MSGRRWWLVLNGKAAGDDDLREAVQTLRARGVELHVRVTWEAGDAARYAGEAIAAGADVLIAAGGDGTLHAIASALASQPADAAALPALALVPMGTANDFASAAGIPDAPLDALELIARGRPHPLDLLRLEGDGQVRWCVNLASGGFGTRVTTETNEGLKKVLGGLAYAFTGLARLGSIEPVEAAFRGPEFAWEGRFVALGIGNGRQAGGGQRLCPDATIDDGLLDLTIVPEPSGEIAALLGSALTEGREAALARAAVRARLAWLEIRGGQPLTLNLDGEPVTWRDVRVDCVPGRVRMLLPAGSRLLV